MWVSGYFSKFAVQNERQIIFANRDLYAILEVKSFISQKLTPKAGTVEKWVPHDGENMHLGYADTVAKYGCHSKSEVHT